MNAFVHCFIVESNDGDVRLISPTLFGSQRVEVYYNDRWGTVCDTQWSLVEGQVTCRELGRDVDLTTVPTTSVTFKYVIYINYILLLLFLLLLL